MKKEFWLKGIWEQSEDKKYVHTRHEVSYRSGNGII
jgi:hypothetical protein